MNFPGRKSFIYTNTTQSIKSSSIVLRFSELDKLPSAYISIERKIHVSKYLNYVREILWESD